MAIAVNTQAQIDFLRYNDNFSHLKVDSVKKKLPDKLKYIPVFNHATISFGGEAREQLQYYHNPNFGDMPSVSNNKGVWQLWQRNMVHANLEVSEHLRIFTQLGSTYRFFNPNPAAPEIEENHLSLHQIFVDYHFNPEWMIRVGRQELSYGSHRLITFREGPNTRLTFDAAVIRHQSKKRRIDFIALSPVVSRKGIFDDETIQDIIVGAYANEKLVPRKFLVDYYFLNFESDRRKYNYVTGHDSRRIAGARIFSDNTVFNYEAEFTYQFGWFNNLRTNAYSLSADLSYSIIPKGKLILGAAGNYVSGDKSKDDMQLNTYNSLFSKPLYGLTAPIGATNIITANPYLKLSPVKRSTIYVGAYLLWRQSTHDGSYTPAGIEVRPGKSGLELITEKRIGTLFSLETNFALNKHLSFAFDASQFFASDFLNQSGKGRDISYLSFKASYKF